MNPYKKGDWVRTRPDDTERADGFWDPELGYSGTDVGGIEPWYNPEDPT
jgi:hypothetical protein